MSFLGWFKKDKKDSKVKVTEHRQNVLQDAAAAAAFAEAGEHETARSMIDKSSEKRKILVIGHEDSFSKMLTEYSLDMAKRLDFELIALNLTEAPLSMPANKREEAISLFQESSASNSADLKKQAEKAGITLSHLVEIGDQDEVIAKLHAQHPGLRYVLTEPDPEVAQKAQGQVAVPVFDLACSHGAAA